MAMYSYQYQGGSEIQADDGLQTLFLMNPNYFLNQPNPNTPFVPHAPPIPPHAPPPPLLTGIPLSPWETSLNHHHHQHRSDYGYSNQPNTPQQNQAARGLSLTLSPHSKPNAIAGNHGHFPAGKINLPENNCSSENLAGKSDYTAESVIRGSKYLRAAREVLDEVVGVGKGRPKDKAKMVVKDSIASVSNKVCRNENGEEDGNNNGGGVNQEPTAAQRQEILMKKAILTTMFDEVEQRYRHYHHQMQIIVASFEHAAGPGSAKSYTHLALKTILKQFKCLKNTIAAQIAALSTSLGETTENAKANIILEGSRLKFINDHHLWQPIRPPPPPSSSQQLGNNNNIINNNNAWRPQRGLPEKAVSVLRAWLFEHFLHPYPKDSDKHMLAKQTGLTRSQVSNWFINARVRLWKPMIEDMYLDEIKNQETNNLDHKNMTKPDTHLNPNLKPNQPQSTNTTTISSPTQNDQNPPEKLNPKKPRNKNFQHNSPLISPSSLPHNMGTQKHMDYRPISKGLDNHLSSFGFTGTYEYPDHRQISSGSNFPGNNSSFSLTLGPPPSETYSQGQNRHNFFPGFEFGERIVEPVERNIGRVIVGISDHQAQVSCPNIVEYESVDFQDRRKPFPAQLLPDHFVT